MISSNELKIFVDRLKEGHVEAILVELSPACLDVQEEELHFTRNVTVQGKAYLADGHLVLHASASTSAQLPCLCCNGPATVPICTEEWIHTEPLHQISDGVFDFSLLVREAILLQIPQFAECHSGQCPERDAVAQYAPDPSTKQVHFPFLNLKK